MAVISTSLFSYRQGNSVLHKTPAILKLILLFLLCIFTFLKQNYNSLDEILSFTVILQTSICFFISILMFFLGGKNFQSLKNLKFVAILGAMVIFLKTINIPTETITNPLQYMNIQGFAEGVLWIIRFFITTLACLTVFETTSSLQIKEALGNALVISLAINFIPEIFRTWEKIKSASFSRSIYKKNGKTKHSFKRAIIVTYQELSALFSCMLYYAEIKRKALLNRS